MITMSIHDYTYHSFISMWQEHDQSALANPLGLSATDELVEDALRVVCKVPELGLPADERIRVAH